MGRRQTVWHRPLKPRKKVQLLPPQQRTLGTHPMAGCQALNLDIKVRPLGPQHAGPVAQRQGFRLT
jgi:hypothetical protein